jgi:hypothetical protein
MVDIYFIFAHKSKSPHFNPLRMSANRFKTSPAGRARPRLACFVGLAGSSSDFQSALSFRQTTQ